MGKKKEEKRERDVGDDLYQRERWVLLKLPRCDIDGLGEEQ